MTYVIDFVASSLTSIFGFILSKQIPNSSFTYGDIILFIGILNLVVWAFFLIFKFDNMRRGVALVGRESSWRRKRNSGN